jgi:hypothetical protein
VLGVRVVRTSLVEGVRGAALEVCEVPHAPLERMRAKAAEVAGDPREADAESRPTGNNGPTDRKHSHQEAPGRADRTSVDPQHHTNAGRQREWTPTAAGCLSCAHMPASPVQTAVQRLQHRPATDGNRLNAWARVLDLTSDARPKATYLERIRPKLADGAISAVSSSLAVSELYAADIRARRCRPHPRDWLALAQLVGIMHSHT